VDPETILEQLRIRPFQPFRIYMSDGSYYDVRHPEWMLVTRRRINIAVNLDHRGLGREVVTCAPIHVTRIEPIA
jgi:hypothetical protein